MGFILDPQLASSCFELCDWPLSRVLLKNNAKYPWFILVPRQPELREIDQLTMAMRHQLMDEMSQLASLMKNYFKPDKLNIGSLGNIVTQFHMHVIGRFRHDDCWPHGVWQAEMSSMPYEDDISAKLCLDWQQLLTSYPPVMAQAII